MLSEKRYIEVKSPEEEERRKILAQRTDTEAQRLSRFLSLPDLSHDPSSPLSELVGRIKKIERFSHFDEVKAPEIVRADVSFDLFNFPPDHPARKPTDTYFVDEEYILRTHTTVMWYYYLNDEAIKEKIKNGMSVGSFSHGKVYRKDEIDRNHMNVFHQIDGWYLTPKSEKIITIDDLKEVLIEIVQAVLGKDVVYRINPDNFPYTDPSLEMEVQIDGRWVEVLGSGMVQGNVLERLGVDPNVYNGWAFGFGMERLAIISMSLPDIRLLWSADPRIKKQLHLGNAYIPVSKYPPITRDISFVVPDDFIPNNYFDLIRDIGGELVEEVKLLDKYENVEKFGEHKISYTYRITYRSNDRTLISEEVDVLQEKVYDETAKQFNALLR